MVFSTIVIEIGCHRRTSNARPYRYIAIAYNCSQKINVNSIMACLVIVYHHLRFKQRRQIQEIIHNFKTLKYILQKSIHFIHHMNIHSTDNAIFLFLLAVLCKLTKILRTRNYILRSLVYSDIIVPLFIHFSFRLVQINEY